MKWTILSAAAAALMAACGGGGGGGPDFKTREELIDSETCKDCHEDHYREWSGSMHAYASDDPVFRAMNARGQRETDGALGDFCVKCHAPMAVREGATTDGLNLDDVPGQLKGVTCFFCHSVDSVDGAHNNPLVLADDLVMRGEYDDPVDNEAHPAAYSPLHDRDQADSAQLCGTCHDIVVDERAAIERTFTEWQASVFSQPGGATCGQCHMDQSTNLRPIADDENADVAARRYHSHMFPAIDVALTPDFPEADAQRDAVQSFLDSTLQSALCVAPFGAGEDAKTAIRVVLDNVAAGHGFPSGSAQDRRIWIEVVAYRGDEVVYQSGVVPEGELVTTPPDPPDPDRWLLRDCMLDADGNPVSMFWQADDYETNQLPAQVTFDANDPAFYKSHIVQFFPRDSRDPSAALIPGLIDRVTLRVLVQPMGLDVLGELVDSGDLSADIVDQMPTYEIDLGDGPVLEWTADTANQEYSDLDLHVTASCISLTNLNAAADKVPATNHTACQP
ncbi:MAG TPA: multiheme c-type cytochrome [Kofleriaceae bacterium]|nr:multiheme c-type cytochrome [Kofleriaceae bacterium]